MWSTENEFWAAAKLSTVWLQRKIQNVYLWEIITFDLFSYNSTKCYLQIHKQLVNLVYNDVKNLA